MTFVPKKKLLNVKFDELGPALNVSLSYAVHFDLSMHPCEVKFIIKREGEFQQRTDEEGGRQVQREANEVAFTVSFEEEQSKMFT